jgi:hypothetical protein
MPYYGIILPQFWTGQTGRALRDRGGKDALLLGAYLFSNERTNMIGLYRLTSADIRSELQLSPAAIRKAFEVMRDEQFAFSDDATGFVWVREMARIRLNIADDSPLEVSDKKRIGAERLYLALPPNALLGPFYDRYHRPLRLKARREGVLPFTKGLRSGFEGASKGLRSQDQRSEDQKAGIRDQRSEDQGSDQDQRSGKSSAAVAARNPDHEKAEKPDANVGVITKIAHEVIDQVGPKSPELVESVKSLCAQRHIAYSSAVIGGAIESAIAQRRHAR